MARYGGLSISARLRLMRTDPTELAAVDWTVRPVGWDDEREQHWRNLTEGDMAEGDSR